MRYGVSLGNVPLYLEDVMGKKKRARGKRTFGGRIIAGLEDARAGRTHIFKDVDAMHAGLDAGLRGLEVDIFGPIGRLVVTGNSRRPLTVVLPKRYATVRQVLEGRLRSGVALRHRDGRNVRLTASPYTVELEAINSLLESLSHGALRLDRGYHSPRRQKKAQGA